MKRFLFVTVVALGVLWLAFGIFGEQMADLISSHFGEVILRVGAGKFDDVSGFVHGRIEEVLILCTAGIGLVVIVVCALRGLRPINSRLVQVLAGAAVSFSAMNGMIWICGSTVCYWMALYSPVHIDNFVQFEIKRGLFDQSGDRRRMLIMGNSQANRCIDETILNERLGNSLWSTDFTLPGARGFDLLVVERELDLRRGDLVVIYVSEISFYGGGSGIVVSNFLHFRDLQDLFQLDGWNELEPGSVQRGLLGRMIPCFRHSEPLSRRMLGGTLLGLKQAEWDEGWQMDPNQQATRHSDGFEIDAGARFQWGAFNRLVAELAVSGCQILILEGDLHPALLEQIPEKVQRHMRRALSDLVDRHQGRVEVLPASDLFAPDAKDFEDLVHFSDDAQMQFSEALAEHLKTMTDMAPDEGKPVKE